MQVVEHDDAGRDGRHSGGQPIGDRRVRLAVARRVCLELEREVAGERQWGGAEGRRTGAHQTHAGFEM
ncbi:MAG: hypothetical protein R2736_17110 [Solirubrobacterales bacterium]